MDELLTEKGGRKYLNQAERENFLREARVCEKDKKYFALMLYHSGGRLNEVLQLTVGQIDLSEQDVILHTLKKRDSTHYRRVPVPGDFLEEFAGAYDLRRLQRNQRNGSQRFFNFTDRSGKRYISRIMDAANIIGPQACARGLRHSFGVRAIENDIPLTELQELLGHSYIQNTAIYSKLRGAEKRAMVSRMWE